MSAATEATLAELLQVASAQNVNLIKLQKIISDLGPKLGAGGGGGSDTGQRANEVSNSLLKLNPIIGATSAVFGMIGSIIGGVTNLIKKMWDVLSDTAKSLVDFSLAAAQGRASVSDLFAAFSKLPFFIGDLASVFSNIMAYAERLLITYLDLTKSGAEFGGSIDEMRHAAARSFMTLDDFSSIVKANSDIFATMGMNVQKGINRFVDIQNKAMGPGSPYANQFFALGYTAQTAAEAITDYMRGQATMNKKDLENNDTIIKGTLEYARQLDALSRITGKRKEQLQDEANEIQREKAWELFVSRLDAKTANMYKTLVTQMAAQGGKGMAEQLKLAFQGYNATLTREQQLLFSFTGGRSSQLIDTIVSMTKSGSSLDDMMIAMTTGMQHVSEGIGPFESQLGLLRVTMPEAVESLQTVLGTGIRLKGMSRKEIEASIRNQRAQDAMTQDLMRNQQSILQFGETISSIISAFFGPSLILTNQIAKNILPLIAEAGIYFRDKILPFLINASLYLIEFVKKLIDIGKPIFNEVIKWFGDTYDALSNTKNFGEFFSTLLARLELAWNDVFNSKLWTETIKPKLESWIDIVMEDLVTVIIDSIKKYFGIETSKEKKKREEIEASVEYKEWAKKNPIPTISYGGGFEATYNIPDDSQYQRFLKEKTPKRASGSLGVTGSYFENFGLGTPTMLHGTESVVTPSQMNDIISSTARSTAAAGNTQISALTDKVDHLSNLTSQMLYFMKQTAENTKMNVQATRSISGDLLA